MKRFVILLIVLVLAFLVVACANDVQSRGLDIDIKKKPLA